MASSWERLATVTLGSAGDTIDSGTITAKKHLEFVIYAIADGTIAPGFRFNSDTGTNYARRRNHNGTDGTNTSANEINSNGASTNQHITGKILNIATKEKELIAEYIIQKTAGAGNAPDRMKLYGKWTNTSNQITSIQVYNTDGGSFDTGSTLTIWGADDQASTAKDKSSITNIPAGTRYEETDTRKIFRRKAGDGSAQNTDFFNLSYSTEKQAAVTSGSDPTGKVVITHGGSNPESKAWATFANGIGDTKTFVIKFTLVRNSGDNANNNGIFFGNAAWDDDVINSGTQKRIEFGMNNGNVTAFALADADDKNNVTDLALQGSSTTKYYSITGNGTTCKIEYWSSAARSGSADSSSSNVSFPTNWLTRSAINVVTFGGWGGGGNASNIDVKEMSISYDGGAQDAWVEKGTA